MHTEQLFNNAYIHTINTEYALMLAPEIHVAVKMSPNQKTELHHQT